MHILCKICKIGCFHFTFPQRTELLRQQIGQCWYVLQLVLGSAAKKKKSILRHHFISFPEKWPQINFGVDTFLFLLNECTLLKISLIHVSSQVFQTYENKFLLAVQQ